MTAALSRFFDSYVDAFIARDVESVARHWRFPALISSSSGNRVLAADRFADDTAALCDFYVRQGMASARKTVVDTLPLGPATTAVTTDDVLLDDRGDAFVGWRYGYVVRDTDAGPRLIAAAADDEIRAWAARGTPLGS